MLPTRFHTTGVMSPFPMQPKASVVCCTILPVLTRGAGMFLFRMCTQGDQMRYLAGTLGPSTPGCGLGQVKVVLEDGLGEL